MKQVCRRDRTNKKPPCIAKVCWYKAKGLCEGPIIAEDGYYSYYNCPDEPDTGGMPKCGEHTECIYCRQYRNGKGWMK